ncbi:MAG: phosphoribosyl-ATP diphosphatase [Oscillospiraceae bacterium]|jgi:phosphoribosyl-ATP pyrophosphohydrolase|nr:phosphoribosyl-ATP diphosphatase [Oscillospiraceae bacterium]
MSAFEALYQVILERRAQPREGSYTNYLFEKGLDKILKKCGEECAETIIAAKNGERSEVILELSDLAFHVAVLMAELNIHPEDIAAELAKRSQKSGNLKQFHAVDKNS